MRDADNAQPQALPSQHSEDHMQPAYIHRLYKDPVTLQMTP